jgi:hypothetical protein
MKLEPLKNWVIGRVAIAKLPNSSIVLPGAPRGITRCYLLDAVSPEAAKAGFAPGDLVIALKVYDLVLLGPHRVTFPIDEAIVRVGGAPLSAFVGVDGKPIEANVSQEQERAA